MEYYDKGDYYRALQVFDQLIPVYRGTAQSEELFFRYAHAYYKERDYVLASYYFSRFAITFPRSENAEEAAFLAAFCKYLESPRSSLDQTVTREAISGFQEFINRYPYGERAKEATELIDGLRLKLQEKDFNIANLYLKIEDYQAAIVSFNNVLKDYPDTDLKEDILYKIILAANNYAEQSIQDKKRERYEIAEENYYNFIALFPESKYKPEVAKIYQRIREQLANYESIDLK
jgi:outer membrane protein assembly factor BamD